MSLTIEDLKEEMSQYKNTLVIGDIDKVVLLLDVVDGEDDFYWVYYGQSGGKVQEYWSSCVGAWMPLKGFIKEKDYNELVRVWNLNHQKKAI